MLTTGLYLSPSHQWTTSSYHNHVWFHFSTLGATNTLPLFFSKSMGVDWEMGLPSNLLIQ